MADTKISNLTALNTAATADVVPIVNSSTTKKIKYTDIINTTERASFGYTNFTGTVDCTYIKINGATYTHQDGVGFVRID